MNQNFRIAITPLSPIHIGCGEVFEPTNYVVDTTKRRMYCFNPASVFLQGKAQSDLLNAAKSGSFTKIRSFFYEHMTEFRPYADAIIPMDAATAYAYGKMLHPQGNQKATELEIFRVAYETSPEAIKAYIPGSSLKGTIKTALVDRINAGNPIKDGKLINNEVLQGDFEKSPLRFLKVADLHSDKVHVVTQAHSGKRFFKDAPYGYCGVQAFFETVEPGQYRCFAGDITLVDSSKCGNYPLAYKTSREMMRDVNSYSRKVWNQEQGLYRSADFAWAESVERLLRSLQTQIEAGKVALVRLGKNAGAESKTLSGGIAQIKIFHPRRHSSEVLDHTTTQWFALERAVTKDGKEVASGLPFGWALLEILEDNQDSSAIKSWCETTFKGKEISEEVICSEWDAIQAERREKEKERVKQECAAAEKKLAEKKEAEKAAQLEAERQQMTPERRVSVELCEKLHATKGSIKPGTELFTRTQELLERALTWENAEDKKYLAQALRPEMKAHTMFQGKNEKKFKQQLRELAGE